jgi:hypothetical protein
VGNMPRGMGNIPSGFFEAPDLNLMIVAMVGYLVVGLALSVWISQRRQLA